MQKNLEIKSEIIEHLNSSPSIKLAVSKPLPVIELSSTDSDSDSSSSDDNVTRKRSRSSGNGDGSVSKKKKKLERLGVVLPAGFLDPLPIKGTALLLPGSATEQTKNGSAIVDVQNVKQFWQAGDYVGVPTGDSELSTGDMDHVRVHPKFLHSNATSHIWVLGGKTAQPIMLTLSLSACPVCQHQLFGSAPRSSICTDCLLKSNSAAFAELLDNSLDEARNGATYVNIDMIKNKKDGSRMLLIEDNGGGMDPDEMRHCMSLGYSVKSKIASNIGQYGNGFKTSAMRLGADVIVFSRCHGKDGNRPTQSIGLLSYTFLRSTGKEDIVVPMLDYVRGGQEWNKIMRSSASDWNMNVESIVRWSPFSSEADLL